MSLGTWQHQFIDELPRPAPTYVCVSCQEAFSTVAEHDFELCAVQYRMELKWRRERGEVIYAD